MKNKFGKRILGLALSTMMFVTSITTAFAAPLQVGKSDASFDAYSMGEIESILVDFLGNHYPNMVVGTPEFYDFAIEQLLGETDEDLSALEAYPLIHIYLSEYKLKYEDYLLCKDLEKIDDTSSQSTLNYIMDNTDAVVYNSDDDISFALSEDFKSETIGDIKAKNEAKEAELENESGVMPTAVSGYNGYDAGAYGRKYGNTSNPNYPHYPDLMHLSSTDCTNFVSQCLAAGGLSMVGLSSAKEDTIIDSTTQWYCKTYERYTGQGAVYRYFGLTTSWLRVPDFNSYMTKRIGSSNVKTYTSLSALNSNCNVGDPVLLVNAAGSAYHAVIISTKSTDYTRTCYSAHTNNHASEPITSFSSQDSYRLFKMS